MQIPIAILCDFKGLRGLFIPTDVPPRSPREWSSSRSAGRFAAPRHNTTDSAYQKGFVASLPMARCSSGAYFRRPPSGRLLAIPRPVSKHVGHLLARSIRASAPRIVALMMSRDFRYSNLGSAKRGEEQSPKATFGQQVEQAADRRGRNSQGAAARRSGHKHIGAMSAKVDNSEIVSAGLNTRLAVVSSCRRASFTERR